MKLGDTKNMVTLSFPPASEFLVICPLTPPMAYHASKQGLTGTWDIPYTSDTEYTIGA